jgi:hypothetical protein
LDEKTSVLSDLQTVPADLEETIKGYNEHLDTLKKAFEAATQNHQTKAKELVELQKEIDDCGKGVEGFVADNENAENELKRKIDAINAANVTLLNRDELLKKDRENQINYNKLKIKANFYDQLSGVMGLVLVHSIAVNGINKDIADDEKFKALFAIIGQLLKDGVAPLNDATKQVASKYFPGFIRDLENLRDQKN